MGKTGTAFDEIHEDEYSEAHEAARIGLFLVNTVPAHAHLHEATIGYLFRDEEIRRGGKVTWASTHLSGLQGASAKYWGRFIEWSLYRIFGFEPDFVILIDRNIWGGLTPAQKLALIDHELCHSSQALDAEGQPRFNQLTGAPIWRIKEHDVEEFTEVIQRHGAWTEDLVEMARAMIDSLNHGPTLKVPAEIQKQAAS